MDKMQRAVRDIHITDAYHIPKSGKAEVHPLSRLLVTILYIFIVVSFSKYEIAGVLGMAVYLVVMGIWYEISWIECIRKIWMILLPVSLVGIANPFFDRAAFFQIGGITIISGMISLLTLLLKGIFCVLASYCLIVTTGFSKICYALRCFHLPKELITMLLLMERYLVIFLKELERMLQAYKVRAPRQKGIHIKTWGAFVGQLFLRTIDRADIVYDSMLLRGYTGGFVGAAPVFSWKSSILYVVIWVGVLVSFRLYPVFSMIGKLFL